MSDQIIISVTPEKIAKVVEDALTEILKSTYSNPVRTIVEKALQDQAGEIKKVIDEIIVSAITKPEFKDKMSDMVIQRMVEIALKK